MALLDVLLQARRLLRVLLVLFLGQCDRPALMGCLSVAIAPLVSVKGLAFLPTLLDQLGLLMSEISAPLAVIVFPVPSY